MGKEPHGNKSRNKLVTLLNSTLLPLFPLASPLDRVLFCFSFLNHMNLLAAFEQPFQQSERSPIRTGDLLRIAYQVTEGEKYRTQAFEGVVIAIKNRGLSRTFTLRRSVQGVGLEQVFFFHSPRILSMTKRQSSKIRRSKLYFLRELTGKRTRLKRRF